MSNTTNPELMRAYRLIEDDDLEKARNLLDSYLESDQNDADAWWLYAHAVTDPMEAQNALRNVLRLAPDYPGAKALLSESEEVLTPSQSTAGITKLAPRPVLAEERERTPDFLDQLDLDEDDEFDTFDEDDFETDVTEAEETAPRSRRLLFILVPILIAVIALGLLVVVINPFRNRDSATPTSIAGVATDAPDLTSTSAATQDFSFDTTSAISSPNFETLETALAEYTLTGNGIGIEQTSLGSTVVATVCNDSTRGLVATTLGALDRLATQSSTISDADYIGVRVVDCANQNTTLRTAAVQLSDAQNFASGNLTTAEFRRGLRPIE